MFKVSNRNARTWCEICSKWTIKTPERRHWRHYTILFCCSGISVVFRIPMKHLWWSVLATNDFWPLPFFAKSAVLDVWHDPEYDSVFCGPKTWGKVLVFTLYPIRKNRYKWSQIKRRNEKSLLYNLKLLWYID